jgi:hypothetical protein
MYTHNCPIAGGWTDYNSWTTCSKTCGGGHRPERELAQIHLHNLEGPLVVVLLLHHNHVTPIIVQSLEVGLIITLGQHVPKLVEEGHRLERKLAQIHLHNLEEPLVVVLLLHHNHVTPIIVLLMEV